MRETKRTFRTSGISIGSASIIMVFAVLALTVFAVLSFVTANNEKKLAEKAKDAAVSYYDADSRAARKVNGFISDGYLPDFAETYSFTEDIDGKQELCVTLYDTGSGIAIHEWLVAPAGEWTPDEHLNVFTGGLIDIPD